MSPVAQALKLASELAPDAVPLLVQFLHEAKESGDEADYIRRRLKAEGAHAAAQQATREALDRIESD